MVSNGALGRPIVTILQAKLPVNIESPVVGLTKNNNEIVVWGGATYFNSEFAYPISYSGSLYEIFLAGSEPPVTTTTLNPSTAGALSGGQIAGIVVGSILGTALIMGCFFMIITGRIGGRGGGGSGWSKHSDAGSELSTRV